MKKLLLLAVSMLLTSSLFAQDIYLRGVVNSWGASDEWKFSTSDGIVYTLEKSFVLTKNFKFADADWSPGSNFGAQAGSAVPTIGQPLPIVDGSNVNFDCGTNSFNVTKIVLNLADETVIIYGTSGKDEFDVTKDYGLLFGQYFLDPTQNKREAMTFKGNGVYEITTVIEEQDQGCKPADETYAIDFGANEGMVQVGVAYAAKKGGANLWFDEETIEWGKSYKVTLTVDKDYNATILVAGPVTVADEAQADAPEVVGVFNLIGQPISAETPGLKIFVYSDGTTEKKF